jgi:hypothetical protein
MGMERYGGSSPRSAGRSRIPRRASLEALLPGGADERTALDADRDPAPGAAFAN